MAKKKIVVHNYFSIDCDVDTTIREAYELGFDRGIQKAAPVVRRDVLKQVLEIAEEEASDPDCKKDNDGCMYSEGWIECGITIAEKIRALKEGEQE